MTISPTAFQKLLFTWFDQHGRKQLPWQQNKTPYRVWVSEIMLQQTQVNTVIPYFEAFMQQFPDLLSLANAKEDEVLQLWSGLGYYSRARNLHRTAIKVTTEMHGIFPDSVEALESLPGIGRSTAGAIRSIAFQQRATILDGNVKRVLARLHAIKQPLNDNAVINDLWVLAERYTPTQRVADYTQAIMDLGATLCTRSKPNCHTCPFTRHCAAHKQGIATELPIKKAAKALPIRAATFLLLKHNKQILLQKRPSKGIWGGLWSFPEITGKPDKQLIRKFCQEELRVPVKEMQSLASFRHTFSHYHLDIFPILISVKKQPSIDAQQQIWYNTNQPQPVGLPKPAQTIMRTLQCHD